MRWRTDSPLAALGSDQVDLRDVGTNLTDFKFAIQIKLFIP